MTPKILVLDDDPEMLALLNKHLTQGGYHVFLTGDAHQALALIHREKPELIICDLTMPGVDGCSFHQEVKRLHDLPFTPFLFIPSVDNDMVEHMNFSLGVDECLQTPIDKKQLLDRVGHILKEVSVLRERRISYL